jgi:hypothetical protein
MISDKQLEANRANAQKSTGPKTEEGKRRSSLNATRHGLTGQVIVLPEENLAAFNHFVAEQTATLKPGDPNETQLAQCWAVLEYRINRANSIEENIYTKGNIDNLAGNLNLEHPEAHNAMCDAETFLRHSKAIGNMSLYVGRLVRQASMILKDLKTLQAERLRNETAELIKAERVQDAFKKKGLVFDPRENGFVFPLSTLEAYIHRKNLDWPPYLDEQIKNGRLKAA